MKKEGVLITGGSGFLGRGLARKLLDSGCSRVCIFSRNEYAQARMRAEFKDDPRLRFFIGDVRDVDRLERAMESVHDVVHAAALKRIEAGQYNPDEFTKTNVLGSMNVIEASRKAQVCRCLLVSSDKAFLPVSPYGKTKALAEDLFMHANDMSPYGTRYAVVRYGNVWGSTGSVLPAWLETLKTSPVVKVTDPEVTRFFMWREEAVELVLDTLKTMVGGELAIPTLPAYRLGDLAEALGADMDVVGLGEWEKRHELMGYGNCSSDARRMTVDELKAAVRMAA